MKIVLYLLALVGAAMGLQYPLEYTYNYTARVATGIPEISTQVAAAGIKCFLKVQVTSRSKVVIQMEDILVGDFNNEVECNIREELPIEYHPIDGPEGRMLKEPFVLKLNAERDSVMEVSKEEPIWVINIKKAIANAFRVEPLLSNFGNRESLPGRDYLEKSDYHPFVVTVPSLYGECEERISLNRIPLAVEMAMNLTTKRHIKEDVQAEREKSYSRYNVRVSEDIPVLKNTLYKVERSVNFDKCRERVAFQHNDVISPMCKVGGSQCHNLKSRTANGEYLIRGEPNAFRLEKAILEGFIIQAPYGYKTQYIQTITNQTITLLEVKPITRKVTLPRNVRDIRTWLYETISPYGQPHNNPVEWIHFMNQGGMEASFIPELLTIGEPVTEEILQISKAKVLEFMKKIIDELKPSTETPKTPLTVPLLLKTTARLLNVFPVEKLRELYKEIMTMSDDPISVDIVHGYFVDMMAASGSGPAIEILLEEMKSKNIPPARIGSVFMTLTSNLVPPSLVEPIVDYVLSLSIDESPEVVSVGLINAASLAHRLCFSPDTKYKSVPYQLFGEGICYSERVLEKFYSYLKHKIEETQDIWKRVVYVQTLVNLGTPHTFPLLSKIALGTIETDPRIRANAIYGFNRFWLPLSVQHELLMHIFENWGEDAEVRQAAIAVMLTWSPSPVWWQRMALSTWRDPSRQVASFVTSTIEIVANAETELFVNMTSPALHVLPLARPVPFSFKYSRSYLIGKYLIPLKLLVKTEGLQHYINKVQNVIYGRKPNGDRYGKIDEHVKEEVEKLMELIHRELREEDRLRNATEFNIYYRIFQHIKQLISVDETRINRFDLNHVLSELQTGKDFFISKYINPYDLTTFAPTDIGIPLLVLGSMPITSLSKGHVKLTFPEGNIPSNFDEILTLKNVLMELEIDQKFAFDMTTVAKIPTPWNKKAVSAGVDIHWEAILPMHVKMNVTNELLERGIEVVIEPRFTKKQPVIYAHNMPFTTIEEMLPIQDVTEIPDMKIIRTRTDAQAFDRTLKVAPILTGMDIELCWLGDVEFPFTFAKNYEYLMRSPEKLLTLLQSPTAKMWKMHLNYDPTNSKNKQIVTKFGFVMTPKHHEVPTVDYEKPEPYPYRKERTFSDEERYGKFEEKPSYMREPYPEEYEREYKRYEEPPYYKEESFDKENRRTPLTLKERTYRREMPSTWKYREPVREEFYYKNSKLSIETLFKMLKEENKLKAEGTYTFGTIVEFLPEEPRKYSLLGHYASMYHSVDINKVDFEIAFLRPSLPTYDDKTKEMCLKLLMTTPKFSSLDTLNDMKTMSFKSELILDAYLNKDCRTESLTELSGNVDMTEERKTKLTDRLKDMCDYVDYDGVRTFLRHSIYDIGELELKWTENLPDGLHNVTNHIDDMIMAYLYLKTDINRFEHNAPRTVTMKGFRPLSTNRWDIVSLKPAMKVIFHDLYVPPFLERLTPMGGEPIHFPKIPEKSNIGESEKCIIRTNMIRTFDGVELEMPHENTCWRLAAKDCSSKNEWLVETRVKSAGNPEIRLYAPTDGLEIILKAGEIRINDKIVRPQHGAETVYDSAGAMKYEIAQRGQFVLFYLPGRVEIVVKDQAEIKVYPRYSGVTCGLCGDLNTEGFADLTGPLRCIYNDTALFDASWTIMNNGPEKCKDNSLNVLKEKVQVFQETCPKFYNGVLHSKKYYMESGIEAAHSCRLHLYSVQHKGPKICVAEQPIVVCKRDCSSHGMIPVMMPYKCYPREVVERIVENQVVPGYIKFPVELPGGVTKFYTINSPAVCTRP